MRGGALPACRRRGTAATHTGRPAVQSPRAGQRTPGRPLARQLGLLCGMLLVPVLALEAYLLIHLATVERDRHQAVAHEAAKGIAFSLDRGLSTLGAVAEVLATSDHLLAGDIDAFRSRLGRLPPIGAAEVVLRGADGRVLMASGAASPGAGDAAAEAAARATGRAQVSGRLAGGGGPTAFAVVVPVGGPAGGVLSLRVPLGELERLLERQKLPRAMSAGVTDQDGRLLASTRPGLGPSLIAGEDLPAEAVEGWHRGVDADGVPIVLAFAPSDVAGWTAWVAMAESTFAAPLRRSLVATGLMAVLLALLAAVLALAFARWITRPISTLARAAARGEETTAATPVREVNALSEAYAAARGEAQRLREVQAELRQVARLNEMGTLAATLAHDINQPLAAAATFAAAALRLLPPDPPLDAAREVMREAAEQSVHAGRIVGRLRDLLAAPGGGRAPADVNALVRSAVALALADARQRGIEPRFALAPDMPPVPLDRVQIGQVVVNLVRNAMEAMDEAPRRDLLVTTGTVAPGRVEIAVADTGPGIAAEVRGRLFSPFVTTKPGGMGVGLAISRAVVEEHGGELRCAPNPGGGSVFRIILPVIPRSMPGAEERRHAA